MFYPTQKTCIKIKTAKTNKLKSNQKFRLLHAATITFGLFLINQPNIEQSQDNFQQILITVFQDLTT